MTSGWCYDDPLERAYWHTEYVAQAHQKFIDEHPQFIPVCPCHPETRKARMELKELETQA